ncbi:MAG: histidine kinase dimerization/phospho-acceptor domain-containing protein, partial [Pseudomonadota bacterium]
MTADAEPEAPAAADLSPADISDAMGELVVVRDGASRLVYVNAAFCRAFGGAPDDWRGQAFCLGGGELKPDAAELRRVRYEAALDTVDGPGWFEWEETPLDGGAGRLAVGRDVTRRKKSEDAMRDARKDAEAANQAKTQFLATMSHEMRTPLNGILGMTGLLLDTPLTANQTTYAEAVRESGAGLLALINDILDFSKIEAGRLDLEETEFDLITAVQSVVELLSPKAEEKGVEVAAFIDPHTPVRLCGDEARLRQVLFNLAGNGVKFTDRGGVSIWVGPAKPAMGDDASRARVRIEVRDTGVGVPEAARERIDEPRRIGQPLRQPPAAVGVARAGRQLGPRQEEPRPHPCAGRLRIAEVRHVVL